MHPVFPDRNPSPEVDLRRRRQVFVGNLSFKTTEEDIRELFVKAGEVIEVRLIRDNMTQNPKGFGFVEFGEPSEAANAQLTLDGVICHGRYAAAASFAFLFLIFRSLRVDKCYKTDETKP
jgi:RNA recognition motif-containing protein